ncbi:hypothetical protein GCM10022393_43480 [Aquimarina addita]|uniref:DUF3592 domain-containing protein n=1 Tax=Aquimarina addita TaxID=870485 RepID=A0ABP6UWQ2_9FLAO
MLRGMIRIFISLIVGFFAFKGLYEIVFEDKDKMLKFEKLFNEGKKTTAYLNSEYKTVTYNNRDLNINNIDYTYSVEGTEYSGTYFFDQVNTSESNTLTVYYLPEEPAFNAINVQKKLNNAKKNYEEKTGLWLSIGTLVVSILLLFSGIRKLKN